MFQLQWAAPNDDFAVPSWQYCHVLLLLLSCHLTFKSASSLSASEEDSGQNGPGKTSCKEAPTALQQQSAEEGGQQQTQNTGCLVTWFLSERASSRCDVQGLNTVQRA